MYALGGPKPTVTPKELKALSLPDRPSIAVLPFTNMSGDPEQIYFSDGRAKVEIALAKGKREYDKRQTLRERTATREAQSAMSARKHLGE